ncbi:hypothetical protein CMV30_18975 [Nibricoccus aquaticus]|uniref:Uncharacterized protein n=1 Tax=Nibricoccus aquaticus TaxID=2576891 RepID=A0A290QMK2_9BACT|nr:hypothetical protein [Nibricoccus aquaticus]ATC65861.1 hypothetical protein CMV30_18975 [Nibricoccus aquaticus]
MKIGEMPKELISSRRAWIKERWHGIQDARTCALSRIMSHLFVLNSGALLAALTYISAQPNTKGSMLFPIWCFIVGTAAATIHAAIDYYTTEHMFTKFREDVSLFDAGALDWEVMISNTKKQPLEWMLYTIGPCAGVALLVGLLVGIARL